MMAVELLSVAGFQPPTVKLASSKIRADKVSIAAAKIAAISASYVFQTSPNPVTFAKWVKAHSKAHGEMTLALADQRRSTLPTIHPTVRAEPAAAPRINFVPADALEWQTNPEIGRNPADLCEFARKTRKPGSKPKALHVKNPESEITLTVYHRGNPVTDTYPSLARALDDAYNLEPNIPWMICLDGEMIHFYNQGEMIQ